MKAFLKNYRQSPRKVRLLANLVRGKRVSDAMFQLQVAGKRAADPIKKLISSAVANAKSQGMNPEQLIVKSITVDKGIVMKRWMPKAFGRATGINKRTSHVLVTLASIAPKEKQTKKEEKTTEKK